MSGAPDEKQAPKGFLRLLGKILKIVLFPFLFMVNPKLYLPVDDEDADDQAPKG